MESERLPLHLPPLHLMAYVRRPHLMESYPGIWKRVSPWHWTPNVIRCRDVCWKRGWYEVFIIIALM